MVPPKVERQIGSEVGVAVMWVELDQELRRSRRRAEAAAGSERAAWSRQLVRAKMFQKLIGDIDPNLGNWLVDPAWNLILVDHSRALTTTKDLVHQMQHIDAALWARMQQLTEETLTPPPEGGSARVKSSRFSIAGNGCRRRSTSWFAPRARPRSSSARRLSGLQLDRSASRISSLSRADISTRSQSNGRWRGITAYRDRASLNRAPARLTGR